MKCKENEEKIKLQEHVIKKGVFDNKHLFESEILKEYEVLTQKYT